MVGRRLRVVVALHDRSSVKMPRQDTDVPHDGRQCDESERQPEDGAYVTHEPSQGAPPCRERVNARLTRWRFLRCQTALDLVPRDRLYPACDGAKRSPHRAGRGAKRAQPQGATVVRGARHLAPVASFRVRLPPLRAADLGTMLAEVRTILDSWPSSRNRRAVVCPHIERKGGDVAWNGSRFVRNALLVRRSSSMAIPSGSA